MSTNAGTRLYALLGDPVSHSFSPVMQSAAFAATRLNATYVALRCASSDVPQLMRAIARAGGGGNITIPHKVTAVAGLDVRSHAVDRTGACNTFWLERDAVHGDNTDVEGFAAAARALVPDLEACDAFVLGAGGAARAAVCALLDHGARSVTVANRDLERARKFASQLDPKGEHLRVVSPDAQRGAAFDLVVNATPLGLKDDDPMPFVLPAFERVRAVLDMVYRRGGTALVHQAAALDIPARDGLDMLIAQGAAAFERWTGQAAPLEAMRAALRDTST